MKQPNRCFAALRSCASVKELPKTSSVGNITRSPLRSSAAKKFAGHSAPLQSDPILIAALAEAAVVAVVAAVVVVVRLHLAAVHEVVLLAVALVAVLALEVVALVAVALVAELDRVAVLVALVAVVPEVVADSSR